MSQRCYMCGLSFRLSSQNLFILEYKWIFEPNVKKERNHTLERKNRNTQARVIIIRQVYNTMKKAAI